MCAHMPAGWRLTAGHGAKAGDLRQQKVQPIEIPIQPDCRHAGRILLLLAASLHVAEKSHLAKECAWVLSMMVRPCEIN